MFCAATVVPTVAVGTIRAITKELSAIAIAITMIAAVVGPIATSHQNRTEIKGCCQATIAINCYPDFANSYPKTNLTQVPGP